MAERQYPFCRIAESDHWQKQAAQILTRTFNDLDINAWPDEDSARKEVQECIHAPNLCIGLHESGNLLGWIGLRPMYERTWELHPLVVAPEYQGRGIGRKLVEQIEKDARKNGIIGVVLGTDDEHDRTSLSQTVIEKNNLLEEIRNIKNLNRHPYEFYEKCGYMIIGAIPNANGKNKPDIWMWKNIAL